MQIFLLEHSSLTKKNCLLITNNGQKCLISARFAVAHVKLKRSAFVPEAVKLSGRRSIATLALSKQPIKIK